MRIPVLIIFGPTASGKTALLEQLFLRDPFCKAEIISADSMQVYRGMDIGTAKPSSEERSRIRHHLIDIRDINQQFNAGEFVRLAGEAIRSAASRNSLPVVSGGTGFYLKNLILGLPAAPPSDPAIRKLLKEELALSGSAPLLKELALADPVSAKRIHPNDTYRLLRALEVIRLTGNPLSSFAQSGEPEKNNNEDSDFKFLVVGIRREREELYRRINERTALMFKQGLAAEVKKLYEAGFTPHDPGMRAIGYREFFVEDTDSAQGQVSYTLSEDLIGVQALIAQNSRRYAKRQLVFFNSLPGVIWIDADHQDPAEEIRRLLISK
ncbi:MAG: tRNA (adenosine(37)-N6)-dimethylallyltransferase MiaA [Treponema sp.]|jgi:tRNA dimethylallyltransferase|nr:tRNA (adenosine(37)-N6)-dimethylallyltransferase MiaA [Treponema sp.]